MTAPALTLDDATSRRGTDAVGGHGVRFTVANVLYAVGSLCFLAGTLWNMRNGT